MSSMEQRAPLSGGTEQQRKDLTQDQYIAIGRLLQGWGYDLRTISDMTIAIKRVLRGETA